MDSAFKNDITQMDDHDEMAGQYYHQAQRTKIRTLVMLFLWISAVVGYSTDVIKYDSFIGISISLVCLLSINAPILMLMRRVTSKHSFNVLFLFLHASQIFTFTAIIYFLGGIEASYLIVIYAAIITYDGIVSPMDVPHATAALCSIAFTAMIELDYAGVLPHFSIKTDYHIPWQNQLMIVIITWCSLFIVAFIASYTSRLLKKNRDAVIRQNIELLKRAEKIERAEQELRTAHQELEKRVLERTQEFQRVNVSLENQIIEREKAERESKDLQDKLINAQKMEALGLLAGGVAHDLCNVLSGITSIPDLMLMDLPEGAPLRKPLSIIQESGKKAASIVQDLLTLARRGVITKEVLNLNKVINEYLNSPEHQKLMYYHHLSHIETHLDPLLWNIRGSSVRLNKMIMNLIINAVEAQPKGGPILVQTENRDLGASHKGYPDIQEKKCIVMTITDSGIGMSKDEVPRIFEPFFTTKVMGRSGTGLGMSVVWGTVQDHDGFIDVETKLGEGTTFTMFFPPCDELPDHQEIVKPLASYQGHGEMVLVVDDIKEQREIAFTILQRLGYSVETVSSGEAAIEYLRDHHADILVLDMIMEPGIDGLETYKRILELHPRQKAIICSAFSESEYVKEAQRLGAGQYIKKPYSFEKLGIVIRSELDKS